jgi:hypothetical protein
MPMTTISGHTTVKHQPSRDRHPSDSPAGLTSQESRRAVEKREDPTKEGGEDRVDKGGERGGDKDRDRGKDRDGSRSGDEG